MACFTYEELLAGCGGPELPEPIRRHVSDEACEVCGRRLGLVQRMLQLLPSLAFEGVPASVVAAASRIPELARKRKPLVLEAILPATGLVPAFRSAAPVAARRLLYRTGPYEVDLALREDGGLMGEVASSAGRNPSGGCTLYGEQTQTHAELDSDGCFRMEDVGSGRHVLVIDVGDELLVVPDLHIPSSA